LRATEDRPACVRSFIGLMQPPGAPLRKLRVVPSAFVSYAHEDQEFVLSLVEHLQGQGLYITYDQSVRTRAAQGLPVTPRWSIDVYLGKVPVRRDAEAHLWGIARGDETARITVMISRTALASANDTLPSDVVAAKETNGRSVVTSLLSLDEPPAEVMVSTAGIGWPVTD
jgi:hypothetical protein